jgi:hypothetical protein
MHSIGSVAEGTGPVSVPVPAEAIHGPKAWGWPVRLVGTSLVLETTSGFCGVEMRRLEGEAVLRQLCKAGVEGPVVRSLRPDPWLVFLAEADTVVEADFFAQHGAKLVQGGSPIPLPPTATIDGRISWAVPPRQNHRWLPGLSAIVWALKPAR